MTEASGESCDHQQLQSCHSKILHYTIFLGVDCGGVAHVQNKDMIFYLLYC